MAFFKDGREVYDTLGRFFVAVMDDDELTARFRQANTVVRYVLRNPEATLTFDLRENEPARVDLGESSLDPEVVLTMDADFAHCLWLGKVNLTVALARGQLRAKGPVTKVLRLLPATKPIFARYRARLVEQGRDDLAQLA